MLSLLNREAQYGLHLRFAANGDIETAVRAICDAIDVRNRAPAPITDVARREHQAELIGLMAELACLDLLARAASGPD